MPILLLPDSLEEIGLGLWILVKGECSSEHASASAAVGAMGSATPSAC